MNNKPHTNPDPAQQSIVVGFTEEPVNKQSGVSTLEFRRLFDGSGSLLTRRLGELLPVAVYICEAPSGTITYYNSRAAVLWGSAPIDGDTDQRFVSTLRLFRIDGTPLPYAETPMAQVLSGGASVQNHELVIERSDRSRIRH